MSKKLAKSILEKINSGKVLPKKRWIFLAKNYGIWTLTVLGVLIVGIFVANAIHEFAMEEWDIMHRFPGGRANFFLHAIPFLWLLGIASAFTFAFFILRKTKQGYKYGILAIAGVIFLASAICGVALLSTPLPPRFREFHMQNFPPSFDLGEWQNPEEGFLFGTIAGVISEETLLLDPEDRSMLWEVDIFEARIPPFLELEVGEAVRVIGEKINEAEFRADFIRPANPHELMREGMRRGMLR